MSTIQTIKTTGSPLLLSKGKVYKIEIPSSLRTTSLPLIFRSNNSNVTIFDDGIISCIKEGDSKINIYTEAETFVTSVYVTVIDGPPKPCVVFRPTKTVLAVNESMLIYTETTMEMENDAPLVWHSSDPNVITVDKTDGWIIARGVGTAYIWVSVDGSETARSGCYITVRPDEELNKRSKWGFKSSGCYGYTDWASLEEAQEHYGTDLNYLSCNGSRYQYYCIFKDGNRMFFGIQKGNK